jgi:hypothetical protein
MLELIYHRFRSRQLLSASGKRSEGARGIRISDDKFQGPWDLSSLADSLLPFSDRSPSARAFVVPDATVRIIAFDSGW